MAKKWVGDVAERLIRVGNTAEMSARDPAASPFSPDDKYFVLQTIGYGSIKTMLYTIPLDWINPKLLDQSDPSSK